jgi:threonine dehydratase
VKQKYGLAAPTLDPPTLEQVTEARRRIAGVAIRTPLLRLPLDSAPDIFLKLENLQPIGSFKIRGAANKLLGAPPGELRDGIWAASAGNMALGAAWCARLLRVPFTAVVPEAAPEAKLAGVRRLGGHIDKVSREEFFNIFSTRRREGLNGMFVHAFSDQEVMAGNATIGIEILEDLPDVSAVYIPYGGGGLSCGISAAIKALKPEVRIVACEPETAAPLNASFNVGAPTDVDFVPSFVDGAGGPRVYPEMFELARRLIDQAHPVPLEGVTEAVRLLLQASHVVAEGAGALGLAAAMRQAREGPVVCLVSGGNINPNLLQTILLGEVPAT